MESITRNEHWVAFVPEAARWPYEMRIFPDVRVPDLPALDEEARQAFGPLYLDVLRRFDAAPSGRAGGKLKYLAGTESGTGVWINDIVPEEAARQLREAVS